MNARRLKRQQQPNVEQLGQEFLHGVYVVWRVPHNVQGETETGDGVMGEVPLEGNRTVGECAGGRRPTAVWAQWPVEVENAAE